MNVGATANLVVSRAVFDQVSGFAEVKSNGDIDFCRRCTERGSEIRFETEVRVRHPAIASFAGLAAKERRKGQGSAEIFLISQPDRTALLRYVMLQIVGLWLQPFQWRHIFKVFRSGDIRPENLRLSALILRLGWIHRWTILKTLLFRSSATPINNPSIGE